MPDERLTKKCVEARQWDKRPKGRPRKTWLDCLKEAGKRKNLSEGEMNKTIEGSEEMDGDSSVEAPDKKGKRKKKFFILRFVKKV